MQFTYEHPEMVNSLISMSTTAGGALYTSPGEEILERLRNPRGSSQQEMFIDAFTLCLSEHDVEKYRELLLEIFQSSCDRLTPRSTLAGQLKAYKEFDAQRFLPQIRQRVKIIHGKNDRLTPVNNARALAKHLTNVEVLILDNCEHCPHIEKINRVIDEINSFI